MTRHSDILGLCPSVGNPAWQRTLNADSRFCGVEREEDSIDRLLMLRHERLPTLPHRNGPQVAEATQHTRCKIRLRESHIGLCCTDVPLQVAELETLAVDEV